MGKQQIQIERVENTQNEPLWRIFTTPNPRDGSMPRQASLTLTEVVKAMGTLRLAMESQSIVLNLRSREPFDCYIIKDLELSEELITEFGWIKP
jgi:hypothetical protein